MAIVVDAILGIKSIVPQSLRDLPPLLRDAQSDLVSSIGMLDTNLLFVLRASRLIPSELLQVDA